MRKIILATAAALVSLTLAAPAHAQYYGQGGVIPCSADDYHFVQGRGWVSNCHRPLVAPAPVYRAPIAIVPRPVYRPPVTCVGGIIGGIVFRVCG